MVAMKLSAALAVLASVCAAVGCTKSHDVEAGFDFTPVEGSTAGLSFSCTEEIEDSLDGLPDRLSCTQLYSDFKTKKVAKGIREYSPAYALWSDGAEKTRWIELPEGEKIDASNPRDWVFPVGTRAFKEFRRGDRRVETRLYEKMGSTTWSKATYTWDKSESEATRNLGGKDLLVEGEPYYVPSGLDCNECHRGSRDNLLGFDQISLGLPSATGVTLQDLVDDDLLEGFDGPTTYEIGDDGSGVAAEVFGAIHINCGVSCHNGNPDSKGYSRGMRLVLDPETLDGRDSSNFDIATTTIDEKGASVQWLNETRVIPGDPDASLFFKLIAARGDQQMPPLATRIVDEDLVKAVRTWIESLPMSPEGGATSETE